MFVPKNIFGDKNSFGCILLINGGSYFSIYFTENEVGCHQLSARKLQSAASIRSYILEGWQSNVIYFPSNAIKAHFEVWRYEKLAVNFGLPINFLVKSTPSSSSPSWRNFAMLTKRAPKSHKLKLQVTLHLNFSYFVANIAYIMYIIACFQQGVVRAKR